MKKSILGFALVASVIISGCAAVSFAIDLNNAVQTGVAATEALQDGRCVEGLSLFEQANEKIFQASLASMNLERKFKDREPFNSEDIEKLRAAFKSEIEKKGVIGFGGQPITGSLLYAARCYSELGQLDKAQKAYQSFLQSESMENITRMVLWAIDSADSKLKCNTCHPVRYANAQQAQELQPAPA